MHKAIVKGVQFDAAVAPLVPRMALVNDHRESLQRLEDTWDQLALLGQMSDSGTDIASTGARFHALTGELLESLARRLLQDALRTARAKAQTCIDILVRNLFERTADIGFLATDDALQQAIVDVGESTRERLAAYAAKYSVYDDIVLLGVDGTVLARLDQRVAAAAADAALMQAILGSGAPFVESFGRFELLGGQRGLLYAAPVRKNDSGAVIGALCLSFRFDDEMSAIFAALAARDDASVVLLLDARRAVLASSDPHQVPVGAILSRPDADAPSLRFGGRTYLAAQTPATGYQGYRGPGWEGCVLVPVDLAFGADSAVASDAALPGRVVAASRLFGGELQSIPAHARSIQRELERLVWNGQVRIRREQGGDVSKAQFAGALLERVTHTGQRISAVFERAIADLQRSAVDAVLEEVRACSALGIDILDRSFYERANDCRWWALDSTLQRTAREGGERARGEAAEVLRRINGLYTVYSQLLLLDARGQVLAASCGAPGTAPLTAAWLPAALALRNDQGFVRSSFCASTLYGDRPTYVFAAPVKGAAGHAGCVAVVFDSASQLQAMLHDALPVDAEGRPMQQALGLFVARCGTVVARTGGAWGVGTTAPFADRIAGLARGASSGTVLEMDGTLYAAGITMSSGYREYESSGACGPDDVACVILIALGDGSARDDAAALSAYRPPVAPPPGSERIAVASVRVGEQWFGLPASQVIEAVVVPQVASVNGAATGLAGVAMHDGQAVAVVDLQRLRGQPSTGAGAQRLLVVCQAASGGRIALQVSEVGTVFDVQPGALSALPASLAAHDRLARAVVRGGDASSEAMLTVMSVDGLIAT